MVVFWSEPLSTFAFVEMASLSGSFNRVIKLELIKNYMEWIHIIFCTKKVQESYWIDLRYSWTYAVVIKSCEHWLKLSKNFDLIERIDGLVVGGLKLF